MHYSRLTTCEDEFHFLRLAASLDEPNLPSPDVVHHLHRLLRPVTDHRVGEVFWQCSEGEADVIEGVIAIHEVHHLIHVRLQSGAALELEDDDRPVKCRQPREVVARVEHEVRRRRPVLGHLLPELVTESAVDRRWEEGERCPHLQCREVRLRGREFRPTNVDAIELDYVAVLVTWVVHHQWGGAGLDTGEIGQRAADGEEAAGARRRRWQAVGEGGGCVVGGGFKR
jgi:hypothetical protein